MKEYLPLQHNPCWYIIKLKWVNTSLVKIEENKSFIYTNKENWQIVSC